MNYRLKKNLIQFMLICMLIFSFILPLCSCGSAKLPPKAGDIDYTVVTGSSIPEDLQALIDDRKKENFELTFSEHSYLYIVKGYGKQKSGGYSIKVNQFYKAEDSLVLDTDLLGPKPEDEVSKKASYPYIVLKTQFFEEPVTFY